MPVGREATAARRQASRLAGLAGRCPAPKTAPQGAGLLGRHASLPGFYRPSATGLATRGSGAAPCRLASSYRHSATGLMARSKGQREIKITLAFCAAKNPKTQRSIPTRKGCVCHTPTAYRKKRPFIIAAKSSSCNGASQFARGKLAPRQLRGSRAAIGSGGKKPCPF